VTFNLAEGLGLTEDGIKTSEDIDWNDQSSNNWAGNYEGACFIRRYFVRRSLSCQISVLDFFRSFSGTRSLPHVL
jgi:hypothetical protein